MSTITFTTKGNNSKIINAILYHSAILYEKGLVEKNSENNELTLEHMDMLHYNNKYYHFYGIPEGNDFTFYHNEYKFTISKHKKCNEPVEFNCFFDLFYVIKLVGPNKKQIEEFIESSMKEYTENYNKLKKHRKKIKFYIYESRFWTILNEKTKRSLNTIYLTDNTTKLILEELNNFLKKDTKLRYEKLGIPYKKNILFEGIPGSGKTSLCIALASSLNKDIAFLNFDKQLTDSNLINSLKKIPKNSILCIEDIDAIFNQHNCMISLSTILNILDGYAATEGLITIITTNYKDKLDKALIRPGRIDKIVHFDYANMQQIVKMYKKLMDSTINLEQFIRLLHNHSVTTAMLQQYLAYNDIDTVLENIGDLYNIEKDFLDNTRNLYM